MSGDPEEVVKVGASSCLRSRPLFVLAARLLPIHAQQGYMKYVSRFLNMLSWVRHSHYIPILLCFFVYPDCRDEIEVALAHH
jgi:hypothetical protein